jgi:molybdenum cofactor synthesis domain-containing protein
MSISVAILTVSDRCFRGETPDESGPLIHRLLEAALDVGIVAEELVPDEEGRIRDILKRWCDELGIDLVLTTGGTGFSPRDVTPEATRAIIERETGGITEAMRAEGLRSTPHAMLSRAAAGIRGRTLIINLPGAPRAVEEGLRVIILALPHAVEIING